MLEEAGAIAGRRARNHDLALVERQERLDGGLPSQLETPKLVLVGADFGAPAGQIVDLLDLLIAHVDFLQVRLGGAGLLAFAAAHQRADIRLHGEPERFAVFQGESRIEARLVARRGNVRGQERLAGIDRARQVPIRGGAGFSILGRICHDADKHVAFDRHGNARNTRNLGKIFRVDRRSVRLEGNCQQRQRACGENSYEHDRLPYLTWPLYFGATTVGQGGPHTRSAATDCQLSCQLPVNCGSNNTQLR